MATILALEKLYTDCVARFGSEGTFGNTPTPLAAAQAANPFGWRETARQGGGVNRIVWVPGDDAQGNLGPLLPPRYPGRVDPGRPLGTLDELFTCYISAADVSVPQTNELAQWKATRLLYDAWYRAVYLAAHGTFHLHAHSYVVSTKAGPKAERRFGATIRVVGAIQAMIPDAVPTLAVPPLEADITPHELDVTDPVEVITP